MQKRIFDGANEDLDQLCQYTCTRPQNETNISGWVIYTFKESVWIYKFEALR